MEVSPVSSLCSHRTNPGLPATGAGDSLPPAGFLHLQLSYCTVVTSLRILCSQVLLRDALSLTRLPRPAIPGLGRLLSSTSPRPQCLHHPPPPAASRPLFQSFCFPSTFFCRFALDNRMHIQSCDLRVPAFVQCSCFGWPRRLAVEVTRF